MSNHSLRYRLLDNKVFRLLIYSITEGKLNAPVNILFSFQTGFPIYSNLQNS